MDLSKLIELKQNTPDDKPLEIKNYKELCELLGEDIKSSASKNSQLKEWKRYFNWTNQGHTYFITKIYDKPKEQSNNKIMLVDVDKVNEDLKKANNLLIFKNYPDFCRYLDIPIEKGNSKKAQLEKLHFYLDYKKADNSNEFVIKKAFYPILEYDKNDLKQLTEYTILTYILYFHENFNQDESSPKCTVPISYLAEMLGYITLKYKYFKSHPKELANKTDIDLYTIYEFYDKTKDLYTRYISESLNVLEKYKFIATSKSYYGLEYVVSDTYSEKSNYTDFGDEEKVFTPDVFTQCKQLSDEEIKKVLKLEADAFFETIDFYEDVTQKTAFLNNLKQKGMSILSYLYSVGLEKKFFKIKHQKLVDNLKLAAVFQCYDIIYNYDYILPMFKTTCENLDEKIPLYHASSAIIENSTLKLFKNTKLRHQKEKKKFETDELTQLLIDRETKEFKQLLDLLIYQQKNYEEDFKDIANKNFVNLSTFNNQFDKQLLEIQKINQNFKKRNKKLYNPINKNEL